MGSQQFCLKWNNHQSNIVTVFEELLVNETLVDVTLACDGISLKAHRIVLSACSPFFKSLFSDNPCTHPIVIMKDIKFSDLKAIVDFMYHGEVNISNDQMAAFLKTAETLRVKGLAMMSEDNLQECPPDNSQTVKNSSESTFRSDAIGSQKEMQQQKVKSVALKRKRQKQSTDSSGDKSDEEIPSKLKERDSPEIIEETNNLNSESASHKSQYSSSSHSITDTPTSVVNSRRTQFSNSLNKNKSNVGQRMQKATHENSTNLQTSMDSRCIREAEHSVQAISFLSLPSTSQSVLTPTVNNIPEYSVAGSIKHTQDSTESTVPIESIEDSIDIKPSIIDYDEAISSQMPEDSSLIFSHGVEISSINESSTTQASQDTSLQYSSESKTSQGYSSGHYSTQFYQEGEGSSKRRRVKERPQCIVCKRIFFNKQSLHRHLDCHKVNPKRYRCDICGKTYSHVTGLYHHRIIHEEVFRYKCAMCSKTFVYHAALQKHLTEKHLGGTF